MEANQPTTASGTFATNNDEEDKRRLEVLKIAQEKEHPLTEAEEQMDLSKMFEINFGEDKNYKTKLCQKRWEIQRNLWLNNRAEDANPKDGIESKPFPKDDAKDATSTLNRKREKRTMKSESSPYDPFFGYYPLTEVLDAYLEIWYKDSSSSDED